MSVDIATTALLAQLNSGGAKPFHEITLKEARRMFQTLSALSGPGPAMARTFDDPIGTPDGASLPLRLLVPTREVPPALILYYHGGGWVLGSVQEMEALGRHLAKRTGAAVALVGYRRAPENPHPAAAEDAFTALRWVDTHMTRLVGTKVPLIVAGDNAGGNLAAVAAQKAAAEGHPNLNLQILICPITDSDMNGESYTDPRNQLFLNRSALEWFWDSYAPNPLARTHPSLSPLRAEAVDRVAPAVILTAEFDVLRDEGEAYAKKLKEAGVPVTLKRFERQMHGFFMLPNVLPGATEALSFIARHIERSLAPDPSEQLDAVVVGAGFAGLYQLYRFRELRLSTRVIDAAEGIGGTWYWNRYPGARCDVESMAYSYSFSEELEQDWVWTERYPSQPEILEYLNHVADRFDLRKDITLNTRVTRAVYDEDDARWRIHMSDGSTLSTKYLVMASGCLSVPKRLEIEGLERYQGQVYHTARWPHESIDFEGQRVAVIGTGSSGVQAIPEIADHARELVVFQRTPNFSLPARNHFLGEDEVRQRKRTYTSFRRAQRTAPLGIPVPPATHSALEVSPEERQHTYEMAWEDGGLVGLMSSYLDILSDREANETAAEFVRSKIRSLVTDPQVAEDLCPKDHALGTKRPCLDTRYFQTFNQEHVRLVNLRKTPLVEFVPAGLRTTEEDFEVDSIVLATGFDAMTGALMDIDIRGERGLSIQEKWANGPISYLGVAVSGFPNLFTITGPSSPSVLSNMVVSIEQHVDWVTDCVRWMQERKLESIQPTLRAEHEWQEHVELVGQRTLFPQTESWYTGANIPGKPRGLMAYIGGVGTYRSVCDAIRAAGYHGFTFTPNLP